MDDLYRAARKYVDRMLSSSKGMKVGIFDEETIQIVAVVYGRSDLLKREVFSFNVLSNERRRREKGRTYDHHNRSSSSRSGPTIDSGSVAYLNAVVIVRPTPENVRLLEEELESPKYASYAIYFTNTISPAYLDALARADVMERVSTVQEYFLDFYALAPRLFITNCCPEKRGGLSSQHSPGNPPSNALDISYRQRAVAGVVSLLLSLKRCPAIRYSGSSRIAKSFAKIISSRIREENGKDGLFKFQSSRKRHPVLLIVDRVDDPVTPLVMQWTYSAMLHECLGIRLNRIASRRKGSRKGAREDDLDVDNNDDGDDGKEASSAEEVVVDPSTDAFFATHMHASFGVVADALQKETESYRSLHRNFRDLKEARSIEHLQSRLDEMPELNTLGRNISKHLGLLSELNRQIESRKLFELTKIEHVLATVHGMSSESESMSTLKRIFVSKEHDRSTKLRLLLLFAIRYEHSPANIRRLRRAYDRAVACDDENRRGSDETMRSDDFPGTSVGSELVDTLLKHMGAEKRSGDLFKNKSMGAVIGGTFSMFKSLSAEAITQVTPLLRTTIDSLLKGKLSESEYPFVDDEGGRAAASRDQRPRDVIVFVVGGGCTYSEFCEIHTLNEQFEQSGEDTRVCLGGTMMSSADGFVEYLRLLRMGRWG